MRKTFLFAAAGVGLMMALASHDAQAFTPLGGTPVAPSDVTKLSQADVALAGTAGRGADAAAITVRAGAVSGAAVGASAARSAAVGVEFEGKVKLRSAPPAYRSGALGTHNRWRHPESGPAVELPAEINYRSAWRPVQLSSLAAADSPLVDQRSSISGCFALSCGGPPGRPDASPARAPDAPFAAAHSQNREV